LCNLLVSTQVGVRPVRQCLRQLGVQAQALIDKTQSKYYAIAVRLLAMIIQAYLSSGEKAEWQAFLDDLKSIYARRPALQAELRKL